MPKQLRCVYKGAKAAALRTKSDLTLIEDRSEALDKEPDVFRGYAPGTPPPKRPRSEQP